MKQFFIITLSVLFFAACQSKKEPLSLDKALIQSFKDKSYEPLQKYFPTKAVYNSLSQGLPDRSDEEIDSFLSNNNRKLIDGWNKMNQTIEEKKIDPGKILIKEAIVYNPFEKGPIQAMIIIYEYDNKTWDDLSMIIHQNGDTTNLLEIPNPTRAFSLTDTSLAESSLAKSMIEIKKPEFQQSLEKQVTQLIGWAKEDIINEFGNNVIYKGDDEGRSWKSAVNMADSSEKELAINTMHRVNEAMKDCSSFSFGKIEANRESEGYWIVQPVNCDKKIIRFAFLKVKGKMMIGDIDVEMTE